MRRARSLVLQLADLPYYGFRVGHSTPEFTGSCGRLADPDLSALTETADVSGRAISNLNSGAEYLSTAHVFVTATQAARAQTLESGSDYVSCGISLAKKRLKLLTGPYTVTRETHQLLARTYAGVIVRAQQVVLDVKARPNFPFQLEVSFIVLRHGRALSEIRTSSPWGDKSPATRKTWNDALVAAADRLKRSGF